MTAATSSSQPARQGGDLADMSPAYFRLVMATGIVSLAAFMMEHRTLASGLFHLNVGNTACSARCSACGPGVIHGGGNSTRP